MFPYSCDALLFHLPIATGVLIAINIAAFVGMATGAIDVEQGWLLEYGTGLHPIEWLLSPFMHGGIDHLLGNMLFLWSFGLITEGKLGWLRFTFIYLGIAIGQSAIEQAIMPIFAPDVPFTLGASAAIYGLMAMACVWAPVNELSIFMLLMIRPITFEMGVGLFALLYVGIDVFWCVLMGVGAVGSITHLMGGAMGLVVGLVLLKSGAVECQDYDLLSVLSGTYGADKSRKREEKAPSEASVAARVDAQALEARRKFDAYMQIDQPQQALAAKVRSAHVGRPLVLDRNDLARLAADLHKHKLWAESAPVLAELIERFPEGSQAARLKLAQICLMEMEKPVRALELLEGLDATGLPPAQDALRAKIRAVAQRQVEEGAVEVDDAAW